MKKKRSSSLVAIVLMVVLAFAVILGSDWLKKGNEASETFANTESIEVTGQEQIKSASKLMDENGAVIGYEVVVVQKGFASDIELAVQFDATGEQVASLAVNSQSETDGLGSKITSEEFLNQFNNVKAPVYLAGMEVEKPAEGEAENTLVDGSYTVSSEEFGGSGYLDIVTVVVENGNITSVVWDAMDKAGQFKSYLSSTGKYVLVEGNPTWKEQADALAATVIENQSTDAIELNEEGKTDSVAGVSINVTSFVELVEKCLEKAAEGEGSEESSLDLTTGTAFDAITGATVSSTAVMDAVNHAFEFISTNVLTK